jgi:glycoside/pentoside/hexuronide:cation symporter, GPH family
MSKNIEGVLPKENGGFPQRPTRKVIWIYALGQFGWSLCSYGVSNLLVYFYLPPEGSSEHTFPTWISQAPVFGVFTIIGLIAFGGRIWDSITDPIIAQMSDKSDHPLGKRRVFMAIGVLPFALSSFLIFFPLFSSPFMNTIWLVFLAAVYYLFFTIYVIPYTALIGELGHHPDDRMRISTVVSITWAMGFVLGNLIYALQGVFEPYFGLVGAFQMGEGLLIFIAFLAMLIPVMFLDEKKYALSEKTEMGVMESIKLVLSNKNFQIFALSDFFYWLAITFIQLGVGFYITILFELDKSMATTFMTIGFFASFLYYVPINRLAKSWGKKRLILFGFVLFALVFLLLFLGTRIPVMRIPVFWILCFVTALPLAIFGILPNAIVADLVHSHYESTGQRQSGIFYASRALIMKVGISFSNLIFPSLLLLGRSIETPQGVYTSVLVAIVFCGAGWFVFRNFKE